jgi:hypothetical protein
VESVRKAAPPEKAKEAAKSEMAQVKGTYRLRSIGFEPGAKDKQHVVARVEEVKGEDFTAGNGGSAGALPPDLVAARAGLTQARAIEQFDFRLNRICKDVTSPAPVELDRFRKFLESARRTGGGDLDAGLMKLWEAANPTPKAPSGEAAGQLAELRTLCGAVRADLEAGKRSHPQLAGDLNSMINKRLNPEDRRLASMENGHLDATTADVNSIRNNVDALRAEWDAAKGETDVVALGSKKSLGATKDAVDVDVEAGHGRRWVQVKNKTLFGTGSTAWTEDVKPQAEKNLAAAHDPANWAEGKPPDVIFQFSKGVSAEVAAELRRMGCIVRGAVVAAPPATSSSPDSGQGS